MIKRVSLREVPSKRGASEVTKRIMLEFSNLKKKLEAEPLGPFDAEMIVLDDLPPGKPNKKNAVTKLLGMVKNHIQENRLPLRAFTRNEAGQPAIYVAGLPSNNDIAAD